MTDGPTLDCSVVGDAVRLWVHAKPRSAKSRLIGVRAGALDVALAAPPVDGAANQELIRTLAHHFGVAQRAVRVVSGAGSRRKLVEITGLGPSEVLSAVQR
jgi:uncharacterized protein